MRHITLSLLAFPLSLLAQLPLPYSTGFDNAGQQAGWQQFRTGHLSTYSWGISGFGAPSAPNKLWHDYPVGGSANDTVRDWWVSPLLDLSTAANLTLKVNVYAITGSTMPSDGLSIMLLTGSPNPALATVTPLQDLLPLVTSGSTYTQLPAVYIPPTGPAYIAFYYQATQNWLTPGIDDVSVTAVGVGIEEGSNEIAISLCPGSDCSFSVRVDDARWLGEQLTVRLFDAQGRQVFDRAFSSTLRSEGGFPPGCYAYAVSRLDGTPIARGRIVLAD